jgi:hypothetical protein
MKNKALQRCRAFFAFRDPATTILTTILSEPVKRIGLADFSQQFDDAVRHLQALGVRIGGTRIDRYQAILRRAVAAEARGNVRHQTDPWFVNAVVEASELIDISTLETSELVGDHVREKVLALASGPDVVAPNGNDPARDYGFEFTTAARAKANGWLRGFPEIGDVSVGQTESAPVECKRISSLKKIAHRLKDARDQLEAGVRAGLGAGVIALDLTRPIRLHQGPIAAEDEDSLVESAERQLTAYVARRLMRPYFGDLQRPGVLGVLVRYVAVGTAGDPGNIRRSTVWQACSLYPDESNENQQFLAIGRFLGPEPVRLITWPEIHEAVDAVIEEH